MLILVVLVVMAIFIQMFAVMELIEVGQLVTMRATVFWSWPMVLAISGFSVACSFLPDAAMSGNLVVASRYGLPFGEVVLKIWKFRKG